MKFRVFVPLILLTLLSLVFFNNQAEVEKNEPVQLTEDKNLSSTSHIEATVKTNEDSIGVTVSEILPKETGKPENKQEPSQIGIEHSIEFIEPNSELHKILFEELQNEYSEDDLFKIQRADHIVELDGEFFGSYVSDTGIEFYKYNSQWIVQQDSRKSAFDNILAQQERELEKLGEWNSHNEGIIYQLIDKFNLEAGNDHNLPILSPINVDCRKNVCSVHFSHPTNLYSTSSEEVYMKDLKAVMEFMIFYKKQRGWCNCRGFEAFSKGYNESSFRFVFD